MSLKSLKLQKKQKKQKILALTLIFRLQDLQFWAQLYMFKPKHV